MQLNPDQLNILFDSGGLGDAIARLPIFRYLNSNYDFTVNAFIPDYLIPLVENFVDAEKLDRTKLNIVKWSNIKSVYDETIITKSFKFAAFDNLSMQMTEHAFAAILNTLPDSKEDLNYPKLDLSSVDVSHFKLPENYVVVTTAFTTQSREFRAEHVNELCRKLLGEGKEIVFLGQKNTVTGNGHNIEGKFSEDVDYGMGLDLRDKTSLLEAAKILSQSDCVVGLDNGLLHLAACSDAKVVAGFTSVKPSHREPFRHGIKAYNWTSVVPPESLECRFCQSQCPFAKGVDFRFCALGTYDCTKLVTGEMYFQAVMEILK